MSKIICLFTNEFPYGLQETFLENEVKYLSVGFKKVYIIPNFKHSEFRELNLPNVDVLTPANSSRNISLNKLTLIFNPILWKVLLAGLKDVGISPRKFLKALKQAFIVVRLKKYISDRHFVRGADLWYFYWGTNAISVLPFLKKHPKSVARYHGYDLYGSDEREGEFQVFQRESAAKLDRAFFISRSGKKYFEDKYGKSLTKTDLALLGVPNRGCSSPSTDNLLRIVTCSNLYPVKRVHLVVEAVKALKGTVPIHWTHFGDGSKEVKLNIFNEIAEAGPSVKFSFMGRVRNHEVMEYYQNNPVDLFINVSESEGLPVSIMEAMSFGIPVLATDAGGTSELVNSDNGELLKLKLCGEELAKVIQKFYKNDYKNESKRKKARETWKKLVNSEVNYPNFVSELLKV